MLFETTGNDDDKPLSFERIALIFSTKKLPIWLANVSLSWQVSSSKVKAVKSEAAGTSADKVWSGLGHFMGLATMIKRPIFSVYPNANLVLRPLMHGLTHPSLCSPADVSPVHIMWSRDGNLGNRPCEVYDSSGVQR